MWTNIVQPGRPQMTVRRMRIACWITKATNTHSEYIIPTTYQCNNGCTNAPQNYVARTLRALGFCNSRTCRTIRTTIILADHCNSTGVLISPLPDLLRDVFFFMIRIFRFMLVFLHIYIYIYIYINSTNIAPIMIINRIYETQNLLSLQLVSFLVELRTYQHPYIL
jgi:hypothetical protein